MNFTIPLSALEITSNLVYDSCTILTAYSFSFSFVFFFTSHLNYILILWGLKYIK